MRWPYKKKTIYDRIKKKFARVPVVINNEWVWLETYYSFTLEDYGGEMVSRFNTYKEAVEWVKSWAEDGGEVIDECKDN